MEHRRKRDPIPKLKAAIKHDFEVADGEFEELDGKIRRVFDEAVAFAEDAEHAETEERRSGLTKERDANRK